MSSPTDSAEPSPRRFQLKRSSLTPADHMLKQGASKHEDSLLDERIQWWRRIDSASYNDHPDAATEGLRQKGSYVPQYAIAQLTKHKSENALKKQEDQAQAEEQRSEKDTQ